jgi:hypothetical protein
MYSKVHFNLTHSQKQKLVHAHRTGTSVSLRLSSSHINQHGQALLLTQRQIESLNDGKLHSISISHKALSQMHKGGILPLLALLPLIFGGVAAAGAATGGIATAVTRAKNSANIAKQTEAIIAANKAVEATAKKGKGHRSKKGGIINPIIPAILGSMGATKKKNKYYCNS